MSPEPGHLVLEPHYRIRWVLAMPRIDPPIARDCMAAPVPWAQRLARQIIPRTRIRDCCHHHSIDWRPIAAAAVRIARQVKRERVTGEEAIFDRVHELIAVLGLPEEERDAVGVLVYPGCGVTLDHMGYDRWKLSYMDGRKRTHAMIEGGVRRTVTIRWREARRQ